MEYEILRPGTVFKSDTVYKADGDLIDIYEADTTYLNDKIYLSYSEFNHGYLKTAFFLKGLKNVVLDFSGAVLKLHGRIQPFLIDDCRNITIRGVTVEYERSFHTEFRIISNTDGELRLKKLPEFPCRVENGYLIPYGRHWENRTLNIGDMWMQVFDTVTGDGVGFIVGVIGENIQLHETPPCEVHRFKVREDNGDVILIGKAPENWNSRMTLVLAHEWRDVSSAFICRSRDISIVNYRILNGAGMGILGMYTKNITIDHLILRRDKQSHGVIANVADAVHLIACFGKITIKDSIIEGMVDDALNIHSNYMEIKKCEGNVLRLFRHPMSHCVNAYFKLIGEGDIISIHEGQTMAVRGNFIVRDVKILDECHIEVTADRKIDCLKGDLVENISTQPEVEITGSVFAKANSHLRLQTRGITTVENCDISLPLLLTGDTNYWYESSPVNDLMISRCRFIGARGFIRSCPDFVPCDDAPWYHENVRIFDNTFEQPLAFQASHTNGIVFENNSCLDNSVEPHIRIQDCGTLVTDEKTIVEK